jgi:hypothetical protein
MPSIAFGTGYPSSIVSPSAETMEYWNPGGSDR